MTPIGVQFQAREPCDAARASSSYFRRRSTILITGARRFVQMMVVENVVVPASLNMNSLGGRRVAGKRDDLFTSLMVALCDRHPCH